MLEIYIARHGQNEDNANGILNGHRNFPLTKLGRCQARELAAGIKAANITFNTVYSSPLCRAFETAMILANELNLLNPLVLPTLIERDFGVMTGKRISEIESFCSPHIIKTRTITYFLCPEGAEIFPALLKRGRRILAQIKSRHKDGKHLLVTHGDIGKMIYAAYYGLTWEYCLSDFHFGNSELLVLSEKGLENGTRIVQIPQYNH